VRNCKGAVATCLVYCILLIAAITNGIAWLKHAKTEFTSAVKFRANDESRVFTQEDDGF